MDSALTTLDIWHGDNLLYWSIDGALKVERMNRPKESPRRLRESKFPSSLDWFTTCRPHNVPALCNSGSAESLQVDYRIEYKYV